MKCFYHPDREAVAVCSKCGKPLCQECAKEFEGKIYCKDCLEEIKKDKKQKEVNSAKIVKVSVILSLIAIGVLLLLFFIPSVIKHDIINRNEKSYSYGIPLSGEKTINIETNTNNTGIKIESKENAKNLYDIETINVRAIARYDKHTKTLTVTTPPDFIIQKGEDREITIYIPKTVSLATLNAKSKVGSIGINGINASQVSIKSGVGSVSLENVEAKSLDIKEGTGSLDMEECALKDGEHTISLAVGDVTINGISTNGELNVKLGTGDFRMDNIKRLTNFYLKQGTGDCSIDFSHAKTELKKDWHWRITKGIGDTTINVDNWPTKISFKSLLSEGTVQTSGNFSYENGFYITDKDASNFVYIDVISTGAVKLIGR